MKQLAPVSGRIAHSDTQRQILLARLAAARSPSSEAPRPRSAGRAWRVFKYYQIWGTASIARCDGRGLQFASCAGDRLR
eukprot:4167830-Pyramimonas_sp.AAC.1